MAVAGRRGVGGLGGLCGERVLVVAGASWWFEHVGVCVYVCVAVWFGVGGWHAVSRVYVVSIARRRYTAGEVD